MTDRLGSVYNHLFSRLTELSLHSSPQHELRAVLQWAQRSDEANRKASSFVLSSLWTCAGVGGKADWAVPVAAAWRVLHLAAQLFDCVQDDHRLPVGIPLICRAQAVSVATSFLFLAGIALEALIELEEGCNTFIQVRRCLDRAALEASSGQHADLSQRTERSKISPQRCLAIMAAKSGQVFSAACQMGAIVGKARAERVGACAEFGYNLGIMGQIADDWLALTAPPEAGSPDLAGSLNLAVAYAYAVLPDAKKKHLSFLLAKAATDARLLAEVRQLLLSAGGSLYLVTQSQLFRQRAKAALESAALETGPYQSLRLLLDRASLMAV